MLNGNPLPWVQQVNHLGHTFDNENNLFSDTRNKKFKFIGKIHSLSQEFYFAAPEVKVNIYDKYASSFYGSNLWNLFCHETEKIYSAYNMSIRQAFKLPFCTHRYLIQPLIQHPHIKTQLCSKFIKFTQNNDKCKKPIISPINQIIEDLGKVLSWPVF